MSITNYSPKEYVIKYMDEYGECYHEMIAPSYFARQKLIKKWKGKDRFYSAIIEDVVTYTKNSGEELWVYENISE